MGSPTVLAREPYWRQLLRHAAARGCFRGAGSKEIGRLLRLPGTGTGRGAPLPSGSSSMRPAGLGSSRDGGDGAAGAGGFKAGGGFFGLEDGDEEGSEIGGAESPGPAGRLPDVIDVWGSPGSARKGAGGGGAVGGGDDVEDYEASDLTEGDAGELAAAAAQIAELAYLGLGDADRTYYETLDEYYDAMQDEMQFRVVL